MREKLSRCAKQNWNSFRDEPQQLGPYGYIEEKGWRRNLWYTSEKEDEEYSNAQICNVAKHIDDFTLICATRRFVICSEYEENE